MTTTELKSRILRASEQWLHTWDDHACFLRPRLMVYFTTTPMVLLRPRLIVRSWRGHNMSILLGNLRLAFSEIPLQVIKFLCITLICLTSSDDSYLLIVRTSLTFKSNFHVSMVFFRSFFRRHTLSQHQPLFRQLLLPQGWMLYGESQGQGTTNCMKWARLH